MGLFSSATSIYSLKGELHISLSAQMQCSHNAFEGKKNSDQVISKTAGHIWHNLTVNQIKPADFLHGYPCFPGLFLIAYCGFGVYFVCLFCRKEISEFCYHHLSRLLTDTLTFGVGYGTKNPIQGFFKWHVLCFIIKYIHTDLIYHYITFTTSWGVLCLILSFSSKAYLNLSWKYLYQYRLWKVIYFTIAIIPVIYVDFFSLKYFLCNFLILWYFKRRFSGEN